MQRDPPEVRFPVTDVTEALGDPADFRSPEARVEIYWRLREAVTDSEPLRQAFIAYASDPARYLDRYLDRFVEHLHPADVDDTWRKFLKEQARP